MKSLPELIHDYKSGVPGTDAKILQRMQPLIKGTAAKIHCMEREDSQQEFYLSLLQAIPYLNEDSSEGECVKYIQTVILFVFLYGHTYPLLFVLVFSRLVCSFMSI